MGIEAKVIEDSVSGNGVRLVTMQLKYPRFVHAEFMTHRVFSRNASSSRAIPVVKMIEQVRTDPAMPVHWGKNQPGMQAHEELSNEVGPAGWGTSPKQRAKNLWRHAAENAANVAESLNSTGAHKQIVNRILEPWQWIHVVVTATEWENFFQLRCHKDAQPEIQALAHAMKNAMAQSEPAVRIWGTDFEWHLPYITQQERRDIRPLLLAKMSAARCARVSYLKHDGENPSMNEDLELFNRLVGSVPAHASPVEHQAYPHQSKDAWCKNFRGWVQFRSDIERQIFKTA
jgi:hypothetical protein